MGQSEAALFSCCLTPPLQTTASSLPPRQNGGNRQAAPRGRRRHQGEGECWLRTCERREQGGKSRAPATRSPPLPRRAQPPPHVHVSWFRVAGLGGGGRGGRSWQPARHKASASHSTVYAAWRCNVLPPWHPGAPPAGQHCAPRRTQATWWQLRVTPGHKCGGQGAACGSAGAVLGSPENARPTKHHGHEIKKNRPPDLT